MLCIFFRYKNGKAINTNHTVKLGYTLMITEATEKDAGNYTVVLTNPINKMQKRHTFTLLVNGKWGNRDSFLSCVDVVYHLP